MIGLVLGFAAVAVATPLLWLARRARVGEVEYTSGLVEPSAPRPRPPAVVRAVDTRTGEVAGPAAVARALAEEIPAAEGTPLHVGPPPVVHHALAASVVQPPSELPGVAHVIAATRCRAVEDGALFVDGPPEGDELVTCPECRERRGRSDLESIEVWHLRAGRVLREGGSHG